MEQRSHSSATSVAGRVASHVLDAWASAPAELHAEQAPRPRRAPPEQRWAVRVEAMREAMTLPSQLQESTDPSPAATAIVRRLRQLKEKVLDGTDREPAGRRPRPTPRRSFRAGDPP